MCAADGGAFHLTFAAIASFPTFAAVVGASFRCNTPLSARVRRDGGASNSRSLRGRVRAWDICRVNSPRVSSL